MNEKTLCIITNTGFGAILGGIAGTLGIWMGATILNEPWDLGAYFLIIGGIGLGAVFGLKMGLSHPMMMGEA